MNEPVLCYVEGSWAYFTTQPLGKQWGDDWNDAPYEHNASEPYEWRKYNGERGEGRWEIIKVAFEVDLSEPCDGHVNSPYSVEQINRMATPWLRSWEGFPVIHIWAGTSLDEFKRIIKAADGRVFVEDM